MKKLIKFFLSYLISNFSRLVLKDFTEISTVRARKTKFHTIGVQMSEIVNAKETV